MNTPLVSVIIPAYNVESFLPETLQSLVAQTFTDWEAIVVDDGSTDGTATVAEEWSTRDSRIRCIAQPNRGVSQARNAAIQLARAELLALLDGDDLWEPTKLETQVLALARYPQADLVFCPYRVCDAQSRSQGEPDHPFQGLFSGRSFFGIAYTGFFVLPSSVVLRASVIKSLGGFDASLRSFEDWELWLRLSQGGCTFLGLADRLLCYRERPDGLSRQGDLASALSVFPRYADSPWLDCRSRPKPFRIAFRNNFTYLGRLNRVSQSKAMFDLYRPYDSNGSACRVLWVLRYLLPTSLFWFVSRFLIIPLAWHLERWGEARSKR